jgi:hypothetical protein
MEAMAELISGKTVHERATVSRVFACFILRTACLLLLPSLYPPDALRRLVIPILHYSNAPLLRSVDTMAGKKASYEMFGSNNVFERALFHAEWSRRFPLR